MRLKEQVLGALKEHKMMSIIPDRMQSIMVYMDPEFELILDDER